MRLEHIVCLEYHNVFPGIFPEVIVQPSLQQGEKEISVNWDEGRARSHLICVELRVSRDPEEVCPVLLTITRVRLRLSLDRGLGINLPEVEISEGGHSSDDKT